MGFTDPNKIFLRPLHLDEILAAYPTDSTIVAAVTTVKNDLLAIINTGVDDVTDPDNPIKFNARTTVDGKCGGNGYYSKQDDTGNDADANTKRLCNSCGAWGYVETANVPAKTWSLSEEPKTEV